MKNKRIWVAGWLFLAPGIALAGNNAQQLLTKMQRSVGTLNYQGELVFSRGDSMNTYRIHHDPKNISTASSVNLGTTAGEQGAFSLADYGQLKLPDPNAYRVDQGKMEVVAGHACRIVLVRPKDKMRYLHRFCIAPHSGMLLSYRMMDREQKVLEQLLFTRLKMFVPEGAQNTTLRAAQMSASATNHYPWKFVDLPQGFKLQTIRSDAPVANAHHVVLSDGMSHVSAFIVPLDQSEDLAAMRLQSGATQVLAADRPPYRVTIIGEVPTQTLQDILSGFTAKE